MRHPIVVTLATAFVLGAPPLDGIAHAQQMSPTGVSVTSRATKVDHQLWNSLQARAWGVRSAACGG